MEGATQPGPHSDLPELLLGWPHLPYVYCGAPRLRLAAYVAAQLRQAQERGQLLTLRENDGLELLHLEPLPWDSKVLGLPVARIAHWIRKRSTAPTNLLRNAISLARDSGIQYLWARVAAADVEATSRLQAAGFELIDGLVTFGAAVTAAAAPANPAPERVSCGPLESGEIETLSALSADSFRVGRFHDPALPKGTARKAYRCWLEDSCAGFADCVLVARDGSPVGFTTVKADALSQETIGIKTAVIGLVATATEHRGQGIARALARSTIEWCRRAGCGWVEVGTQMGNIPACRLYESVGFKTVGSSFTFRLLL